jgi:hypothetical protein
MAQDKAVRVTAASALQTVLLESDDPQVVEHAPGYECSIRRYDEDSPWQLTLLGLLNGLLAKRDQTLVVVVDEDTGELLDAKVEDGAFSVGP